ncbi:Transcription factor like [Thalictrum thalictroides]|uniref:Transcription factor like n=1 Tax=Thalictrum thalictroides TaxID=46969 RepID=A0A7J6XGT7_THATH|nr:Transcription factor like [Thalictrum thalictroides]
MPYSHLHRMAKEKLESLTHQRMTNSFKDLASVDRPDSDFSELVWENGQILMQGQSNKARKSSVNTNTTQRKEEENATPTNTKKAHSGLNDFSAGQSSRTMGFGQDDELVHWLNYPIDEYSSEFFSEFSHQNTFSEKNTVVPVVKNMSNNQLIRNSQGGANPEQGNLSKFSRGSLDHTRVRDTQLCSVPQLQQLQRVPDSTGCNTNDDELAHSTGSLNLKIQQQKPEVTQPNSNTGFTNFSHFLKPATFVKSSRQSANTAPTSSPMSIDRLRSNDKESVVSGNNRIQSTVIDSANGSKSFTGHESKFNSSTPKGEVKPPIGEKPPKVIEQSVANCQEDAFGKSKFPEPTLGQTSSFAASMTNNEKCFEPVVDSSSVCSGTSAMGASYDLKHQLKRKTRDTEDSDYLSEDIEEESVGARKPTRAGTSTKRSRAAEVHNLSERKRRDRINEKMRALQELIPNCNKVDKASMLDEAIEYLKTLQLQLQIMSMGTGLFMPPMMLPNGIQHVNTPNLPPFSPMNVAGMGMGMGMGMGFGMGMVDMTGGSSGCPLIQVPPMYGAQFPYSNLPMMAGANLQMFGPPGQGISMSIPRAPFIQPAGGPSTNSSMLPIVSRVATSTEIPNLASPSCLKDPTEVTNAKLPDRNAEFSQNQIPAKVTKGVEQSLLAPRHDYPPQASENGVIEPT